MKLRKSIFVGLALLPIIASAQQQYRQEIFIGSGGQLANWCLNEMRARYAAKDITTYGHASEHSVDGNKQERDPDCAKTACNSWEREFLATNCGRSR